MGTEGRNETNGTRRWKPGRGLMVAAFFVGTFLVLQLAETVWRHFSGSRAGEPTSAATARESELPPEQVPFPEIRLDGDRVTVRSGSSRTRIRLDEGDDPQALVDCIRRGLEQALGRSADSPPGTENVPRQSRHEVGERVHEVTQRCIDEANGVVPPPTPPQAPPARQ